MKKTLRMKIMFLLFALVVGISNVWADVVTFDASKDVTNESHNSYTNTLTTFNCDDGSTWKAIGFQEEKKSWIGPGASGANYLETPAVSGTITSIAVTWSGNTSYYLALKTTDGTELDYKSNPSSSSTETFTVSSYDGTYSQLRLVGRRSASGNALAKIEKVVVTYTPSSGSDLTDGEFSWSATSFTANIGQSNTYPTLTNTHNLIVSYVSTDESVATINVSTGVISLEDEGTTTIRAAFAGNSTYNAKTVSYTLTVVNPSLTTIWSEDFSGYAADANPTGDVTNAHTGTSVHGGVTITYACTDGGTTTKIYDEASAGGVKPELLVSKNSGTFSVTIPLTTATYGFAGDLTLRYKTNANPLNVKSTTSGITVDGEASTGAGLTFNTSGLHKVTFKGITVSTESITIVFTATDNSKNVRLDDIILRGAQEEVTKVATPVFDPTGGAVASGTQVTITCPTPGASIYYTMGATPADPTASSTQYDPADKPTITEGTTIKAIAIKAGLDNSNVASATYTIADPCATPTFNPAAGEIEKGSTVAISCETVGATIYYTTNGSNPTTSSTVYSSAITVNSGVTIKAMAVKDGYSNSPIASATYTIRDYTTLPFVWTGGTATALTALTGVTGNSLADYADNDSNRPYLVQMNSTSDYITIKTDSQPGMVTVGVKMIGGATTSKIKVQESANGETYTDVEEFTISGSQNATHAFKTSKPFAGTTRYVKIIKSVHANGGNIGVGPITIYKNNTIASNTTWTAGDFTPAANNVYVVSNGNTLILSGDFSTSLNNPDILIIEDGGQLISTNAVTATVQKTIAAPTTWAADDNSGWYAISSTVGSIANNSLSSVTNLVPAPVNQVTQFDLYKYVEGSGWLNYAAHTGDFGGLVNGHGYLYANKNGATLSFTGNITTSNVVLSNLSATSSNDNLKGIHLIGNPYTHNIYKGVAIDALDGTLSTGYYKLDGSNLWVAESDATPIAPGQGFLVKVTDGTTLTLHNNPNSTRANNDYIRFAVANNQYEDATFAMFKEGKGLTKINHRNAEAPMIYINQDNANYAIATMSDATESFSLNFKAMTTGQYTLSFTTQGEFNYLHVIDRLTGADIDMLLEGEYKLIGTPNDSDNRFIVRLAYLPDYGEENGIFAYQSGNEIFVSGEGELQIFDVTGRYVMSERINGVNTINADALSKGVYVLRIIGSEIKTQKIVVR